MPGWLKAGLLAALVVGICWGGAISYWRANDHAPGTTDLVLYLLALPLALIMASGFARTRIAKPAATPAESTTPHAAPAINTLPPLAVVAAALRLPHGDSPEELSAAIADNKARADLDPELVDEDGFPVMTARSSDAVDEALQEEITEWWTTNGVAQPNLNDEQWRAITMATAVAGELASSAASDLMPAAGVPPMLHVLPILPHAWPIGQRRAAALWIKHTVAQFGWPPACVLLAEEKQGASSASTPEAMLGRLAQEATNGAPLVALMVACASHIGEESVARWEDSGSLFTSSQPRGQTPGEGAAGLLLTDLQQARSLDGVIFTLLDPMAEARRNISADETRRTDSALITELAGRALKNAGLKLTDVAVIVADTGHRSNRVSELMEFASGAMPQLDDAADVVRVGAASGTCDSVPFMAALALGRHYALERAAPVLCLSNEDPHQLCAVVIRPYASA